MDAELIESVAVAAVTEPNRYSLIGMCKRPFLRKLDDGRELVLPCGKCLACRIRRRSVWTIRLLHENAVHHKSAFLTLTYDDKNLPQRNGVGVLLKSDLQNFFKRYRQIRGKCKYYACGEYGEQGRPHYHAILYGDKPTNAELQEVWGLGIATSDNVEHGSIAYVAGYVSKKLGLHDVGTASSKPPPFQISSQGLGLKWAQENMIEILAEAAVLRHTTRLPLPRAYYDLYQKIFPEAAEGFNARRIYESDLFLSERLLSIAPELGGKKWSELSETEREHALYKLQECGLNNDLKLRLKKGLYSEGHL